MSTSLIKRFWCPEKSNSIWCIFIPKILIYQKRRKILSKINFIQLLPFYFINLSKSSFLLIDFISCNWIDRRIKVKSRNLGVLLSNIYWSWIVIRSQGYSSWSCIIQMWKCNFVLCSNGMSDNNLIYVVELIPILIEIS